MTTKSKLAIVGCAAALVALADTTVYRLELEKNGETETPYIVGQDGVRREVMLVDPEFYSALTDKVEKVWRAANNTETKRVTVHGARVNTTVTNGVRKTTYKDGYTHADKMLKTAKARKAISEEHARMREKKLQRMKRGVREITVEYDPITGTTKEVEK